MTESETKAGAAIGAVVDQIGANVSDAVAQLQRNLDEVRGTVASLVTRIGDGAVAAGDRGVRQARELAGEYAEGFADRAGEGATALRARIEDQPVSSLALTLVGGIVAGAAVGLLLTSRPSDPPRRR